MSHKLRAHLQIRSGERGRAPRTGYPGAPPDSRCRRRQAATHPRAAARSATSHSEPCRTEIDGGRRRFNTVDHELPAQDRALDQLIQQERCGPCSRHDQAAEGRPAHHSPGRGPVAARPRNSLTEAKRASGHFSSALRSTRSDLAEARKAPLGKGPSADRQGPVAASVPPRGRSRACARPSAESREAPQSNIARPLASAAEPCRHRAARARARVPCRDRPRHGRADRSPVARSCCGPGRNR